MLPWAPAHLPRLFCSARGHDAAQQDRVRQLVRQIGVGGASYRRTRLLLSPCWAPRRGQVAGQDSVSSGGDSASWGALVSLARALGRMAQCPAHLGAPGSGLGRWELCERLQAPL